jgi:hypothetical protein
MSISYRPRRRRSWKGRDIGVERAETEAFGALRGSDEAPTSGRAAAKRRRTKRALDTDFTEVRRRKRVPDA